MFDFSCVRCWIWKISHQWAFSLGKTSCSDVQSLILRRIVFPHLWSEFFLLQLVTVDSCLFTVYIWEESVSIFSMSSFSVVIVAVKSPLDNFFFWTAETPFSWPLLLCHILQLRYRPCDLLLFLIHSSPSCWCSQSLFSRFSMVCWVERENCFF